jgi:hypothetical protein
MGKPWKNPWEKPVKIFPLNQSIDNGDITTNTWGYHQQELGLELCFTQQQ